MLDLPLWAIDQPRLSLSPGLEGVIYGARMHSFAMRLLAAILASLPWALTGEAAMARSSWGHEIRADVVGEFVGAREADVDGDDDWAVRVPLVYRSQR